MHKDPTIVDWLLDCDPRPAQLEALRRSYNGYTWKRHKDDPGLLTKLPHAGRPSHGWGHFMEMRVGKTPTSLNEFCLFRRDYGLNKLFVISPNKYKYAWQSEIVKFGVGIECHVHESQKKHETIKFLEANKNKECALIINYESLIQDADTKIFMGFVDNKTFIVADESVMMKNRNSHFFKRSLLLSKEAAVVRPLTGKPTPQGVMDLYSQLTFARGLNGTNFFQFRARYGVLGGFQGRSVVGVKNEKMLQNLLHNTCFFARRVDWGTKLECDYEIHKVDMTDRQKSAYKSMENDFITWLENGTEIIAEQVLTKYVKLQQITSGFIIDENKIIHELCPIEETPKFKELLGLLEESQCKVVIPFHFVETGNRLIRALKNYNPAIIRGNSYMQENNLDVEGQKSKFNNDPSCRIMIAQGHAVKYGHTLMGTVSDPCLATYFYENSYNLDTRAQVEERNQGEGQLDAIHVVDFQSSPIEKAIIKALQRKEKIASVIMGYYKGNTFAKDTSGVLSSMALNDVLSMANLAGEGGF
jgi:SNF2-related domain